MKSFILSAFIFLSFSSFCSKEVIEISYSQEEVNVFVDKLLIGKNITSLKVDLAVATKIKFFKIGCFEKFVEISSTSKIKSIKVDLVEVPKSSKFKNRTLMATSTLVVSEIVTNFTENDLGFVIKDNFDDNNLLLGNDSAAFPNEENLLHSDYILSAEIVKFTQVKGFYKKPYFNTAEFEIKWTIIDLSTKSILYNKSLHSASMTRYHNTKGLISNDEMKKVVKNAIELNQIKLLNDPDFLKLF